MSELVHGAAIRLRNLSKHYGEARALSDVSLDLPAGEFVTLLGPSGSGKTTTLNMIAGFLQPDTGHVLLDGEPIERVPPHKRNIGMVFQNYALFPHLTVANNVAFPLKRRRTGKAEIAERVARSLDLVGLADFGARYPRELSGGQQQRVALARALVFEPRVLLMDEPLGALDRRLRASLQLEFKRIHRELGITFVYVTHDQDEALVMSDRIAVFNNGRVEQVGTATELYEHPKSLFVAEFLGDSNVLPGVVEDTAVGRLLRGAGYELKLPTAGPALQAGTCGVVTVRPERVLVHSAATRASFSGNALPGRVVQLIYLGGLRRLELRLDAGFSMIAQEQSGNQSPVSVGDAVLATWDPEHSAVLATDDAPARAGVAIGTA
ncbi:MULTISPECIES: ABC transporter ATP-binding protein [unclassified Amycolatopsis]|uniref:ABC transporter ATP-binding protein n=1 Tax=unclassified Amycolatopsis TaxID=2618356 RepID=UPI001EE89984|nr:ABC transporter ATP-binding protein [Amycolatopsis sp. Poz14]MCG3752630.1 ABC transporter ATP-binding protein [Amycolatopsis sp. Poz14]